MHLFLTGLPGAGKSTLLRRLLREKGLTPCGFTTCWEENRLLLCPCGQQRGQTAAIRTAGGITAYPDVFDGLARELLTPTPGADVLVMDELGFIERDAAVFRSLVLERLDGSFPVLGVVKPKPGGLPDAVRQKPAVRLIAVTPETRQSAWETLCEAWELR